MSAFRKKGDRVDIHIWLEERHAAILDAIAKEYRISRAQVVAGLLDDYEEKPKTKEDKE